MLRSSKNKFPSLTSVASMTCKHNPHEGDAPCHPTQPSVQDADGLRDIGRVFEGEDVVLSHAEEHS